MTLKRHTKRNLIIAFSIAAVLALLIWFLFVDRNFAFLKSLFSGGLSTEKLHDQLIKLGWRGSALVSVLSCLQVFFAFLPAEPVQVLSGIAYSFWTAAGWCMLGIFFGNTLIFMLQKIFGDRLRSFFIKNTNLNLERIARSGKVTLIVFILYFLPAIPYGMICFFAASLGMSYRRFIVLTMLGSFPSVCIGVELGRMSLASSWIVTLCIFALLILVIVFITIKKDYFLEKVNKYAAKQKKEGFKVKKQNGFVLWLLYYPVRAYLFLCGLHMKKVNKVGKIEKPAIVLCNHGSFIDFVYAATLIRRQAPQFIVARLYFYNTYLCRLLRTLGAFPKSMFQTDIENVKNCLTVLKEGWLLAMMPEARLSTAGRFEDIQDSTFSFIKKAGVNVYTIKISGDYLADPKWGKGFRRGSLIESELDILYTAEQVKELSLEDIKKGVTERLYYDEYAWLETRPNVHYRSRRMAEGLENINHTCPVCGKPHMIKTKKNKVFCEECGFLTCLDSRYRFDEGFKFKNPADWYEWQLSLTEKEIEENAQFELSSRVELRLPGNGRGLTRFGGAGVCRLNREGLTYSGTKDGNEVELHFSINRIYRLLFGAGENFEVYDGTEILYFVPEERRSAVDWYMASKTLYDIKDREKICKQ